MKNTGVVVSGVAVFTLAALGGMLSCSSDTPRAAECTVAADCVARGMPGGTCVNATCVAADAGGADSAGDGAPSPWGCVGNVQWPLEDPNTIVRQAHKIGYRGSETVVPGVTVRLCPARDVECKSPIDTQTTDSTGTVILSMPKYFRGYIDVPAVKDDAGASATAPLLVFTFPPPEADNLNVGQGILIPLIPVQAMSAIWGASGVNFDPSLGIGAPVAMDCAGNFVPGIRFDVTPVNSDATHPTSVVYIASSGLPVVSPAETASNGQAAILNVPLGTVTFTATRTSTGAVVATYNLPVRAGAVTAFFTPPSPR